MLTVCMIVKDESDVIEDSLKAIKNLGYNIVIADTGSSDNTKEIALKYTDKVYDYRWNENFSDARNFVIEKSENDFILMIDADEIIIDIDKEMVNKFIQKNDNSLGRITILNEFDSNGYFSKSIEKVSRMFSRNYYSYEGSIHEQLVAKKGGNNKKYELPIKVLHKGYSNNEINRKDKINRNISMLKKELKLHNQDPYILYQLGKTYYMALDYENAYRYFNMAMDIDLDVELEYVQDLIECYGYSLINMSRYSEALNLSNLYEVFSKSSDFIFLMGLIYMNNAMFDKAIDEFIKASCMKNAKILGVNDDLAFYNIGVIYECLGKKAEAKKFYLKCKEYEPALERIATIKSC